MKLLKVAAIQPENRNDDFQGNLDRAESLVANAASEGANLILCPELLAAGYRFDSLLWNHAEPFLGPTFQWLSRLAKKHSVYIGASFLELDGQEHFNTFLLMNPQGVPAGKVRKSYLPFFESFVCRSSDNPHVFDSELGRIGVGICFENQLIPLLEEFRKNAVDLVLMPHSHPYLKTSFGTRYIGQALVRAIHEIGDVYARELKIPVVIANKSGAVYSQNPVLPSHRFKLPFTGASAIYGRAGKSLLKMGIDSGYIVKEVELPVAEAKEKIVGPGGRLSHSGPKDWILSQAWKERASFPLLRSIEWMGKKSYERNFRNFKSISRPSSTSPVKSPPPTSSR